MKAMIFAAGIGSRLKPITDKIPKALVPVGGVPMLERTIRHLKKYGVKEIIINIHHFPHMIIQFLESHNFFDLRIQISDESNVLLDTGGGLKKASWFFTKKEDFIVINADIITDLDFNKLIEYHKKKNALATLVVKERRSTRNLIFDKDMRLTGWNNHATGEILQVKDGANCFSFPFSGIHLINSKIFQHLPNLNKFSIINTYLELAASKPIFGYLDEKSIWYDIGNVEKLKLAEAELGSN